VRSSLRSRLGILQHSPKITALQAGANVRGAESRRTGIPSVEEDTCVSHQVSEQASDESHVYREDSDEEFTNGVLQLRLEVTFEPDWYDGGTE
jgi:hypothetical protein